MPAAPNDVALRLRRFKGSPFLDNGNTRLRAEHPQPHQGVCADAIATLEGIDREAVDDLAYVSQQRAKNAIENGHFDKALVPVHREDGSLALDKEEFPRPQTTRDDLRALDPSFAKLADFPLDEEGTTFRKLVNQAYPDLEINHVHHAGNSSGVVDGAASAAFDVGRLCQSTWHVSRARWSPWQIWATARP